MDCQKIAFEKTNRFSSFFLDYINKSEKVKPYFDLYPDPKNFQKQIDHKKDFPHREVLVNTLKSQYKDLDADPLLTQNIDLLGSPKTYTVTTGHQLNIFTGPLYFIYKIVTVINACRKLKETYPNYHFVPVYWMATEDHDFDEIQYFRLGGKKFIWETDQKGAVGRFDPSSIKALLKDIPGVPDFFKEAYSQKTLAEAVRYYVNHLFGSEGLVVIDADHKAFKKLFTDVIKDDLSQHSAKKKATEQMDVLSKQGYETSIFPRDINFFYLDQQLRERIEKAGEIYKVVDTDISFSEKEILQLIEEHPEKFSPNVILRPLYQEAILPNLAYVGGPAEVVYWLPLKPVFEHFDIPFPMVMPRNFAMVIPHHIQNKIDKTGLMTEELFEGPETLYKKSVKKFTVKEIELNGQITRFEELFNSIKQQALAIDPTLGPHVEAQKEKTKKRLENMEKKFIRAEKRNQSDKLRQVEAVLEFLFPNQSLQERTDNFLNFYLENPDFIKDLINCFDPFDYRFHILNYGK
ncbi:MAG: bacillithiol biosynthesis cysteine-adding enzyme BshC [Candidatus Cyclobacteriaceae bacterium M2_1C_046]